MEREIVEMEISDCGDVKVIVSGVKGAKCLDVRDYFREFLGPIIATGYTEEYYEDEEVTDLRQSATA